MIFNITFPSNIEISLNYVVLDISRIPQMLLDIAINLKMGVWSIISLIYFAIIYPILGIIMAHMAYNDCKLVAGFRFREIINKISCIGWKNFFVWYIVIWLLYFAIFLIGTFILAAFVVFIRHYLGIEISSFSNFIFTLIIYPFLLVYFYRVVALFYMSE